MRVALTVLVSLATLVAPGMAAASMGEELSSSTSSSSSSTSTTTSSTTSSHHLWGPNAKSDPDGITYSALTKPLPLYPGEVTNTWHHIDIPPGPIAISEFAADIVEYNQEGELVPVPLSDAYLHHHVVYSTYYEHSHQQSNKQHSWWSSKKKKKDNTNENRGVGFGAGTESRGTPQIFPAPFRFTTEKGEDQLLANVHVINTRTMTIEEAHHCLECPCTEEDYAPLKQSGWHWPWQTSQSLQNNRDITSPTKLAAGVVHRRHHWNHCNAQLMNQSNTACSPDLYYGGLICCEHGEFCLDDYYIEASKIPKPDKKTDVRLANPKIKETQSVYYLRYSLTYRPLTKANTTSVVPLQLAGCCDATGNLTEAGNIEYDIPKLCDAQDFDDKCIHTLSTIQEIHGATSTAFGSSLPDKDDDEMEQWVDVVYMVGHLHRGGMEMSAYFAHNDTLLCQSLPMYGTGKVGEIGNEPGYINAMSTCTFDPPLRMKTTDKLRIVGKYNASEAHTGVMSLFYLAIANVEEDHGTTTTGLKATTTKESVGFFGRFQRLAIVAAFVIVVVASLKVFKKHQMRREGYEQVGTSLVV